MRLVAGWVVSAGLVLAATTASAQGPAPADGRPSYRPASDFEGPYGRMPPAPPPYPPAAAPAPYGTAPALMPPHEVYAVLRENGLLPLGIPHLRGYVYEISALNPAREAGRLLIDGRTGRIIRFMPAHGRRTDYAPWRVPYGLHAALPPPEIRDVPRPPSPVPHVASRSVPLPNPKPARIGLAPTAEPIQSANAARPAERGPVQAQASAAVGEPPGVAAAKSQAQTRPTQDMPPVQGLE